MRKILILISLSTISFITINADTSIDSNKTNNIKMDMEHKKYYLIDGKCSKCGSIHISKYFYGLPILTENMKERIKKKEIILGGCVMSGDFPKYKCIDCKTDLYDK